MRFLAPPTGHHGGEILLFPFIGKPISEAVCWDCERETLERSSLQSQALSHLCGSAQVVCLMRKNLSHSAIGGDHFAHDLTISS